jgi:hypothetical protein
MVRQSALAIVMSLAALGASAQRCHAHFPWLATDAEGYALLFFGESPNDRTYHTPDAVAEAKVFARSGEAEPAAVELAAVETDDFVGRKSGRPLAEGAALESAISYGIYHGMLLDYYAKHVPSIDAKTPASGLKLDATPRTADNGLELVVRWDGKPLAGAGVTLIDAKGDSTEKETDAAGVAKFDAPGPGLIGFLIARMDKDAKGELDGEKYTGAAAYGTVTVNYDAATAKPQTGSADSKASASSTAALTPLPEPVASFGAAVCDGWLYVYGGHTGEEHAHSRDNLSNHFRRLNLAGGSWEDLPMETALQGLPLVAHGGKLYRVGGLNIRNAAGDKGDTHSVAEFACYDPATAKWTALASLPEARSSHDAVVIDNTLYVVGGWTLDGEEKGDWLSTAWSFDLSQSDGKWQALASPTFKRRALALAAWNGKVVALGGMDENAKVSRRVDVLDVAKGQWTELPELPRSQMAGFGVSAWNLDGKLIVSGADGVVHELADDGSAWQDAGKLAVGRFFHRLLPGPNSTLLVVAGASMDAGHLATIESFAPGAKN